MIEHIYILCPRIRCVHILLLFPGLRSQELSIFDAVVAKNPLPPVGARVVYWRKVAESVGTRSAKQAQDHYFEGSLHRGEAPSSHAQTPGLGTLCCVRVFQCLEFCGSRMVPLYRWKHLGFLRVCVVVFLQYILVGSWIGCLSVVVIVYLCLGLGVTCLLFVISPRGYCLCVVCV